VRSAQAEELRIHELGEHIEAGRGIDVPQPAGLGHGEPQTRHLHEFAMHAPQEPIVRERRDGLGHGTWSSRRWVDGWEMKNAAD
jgi:hypothetical protein